MRNGNADERIACRKRWGFARTSSDIFGPKHPVRGVYACLRYGQKGRLSRDEALTHRSLSATLTAPVTVSARVDSLMSHGREITATVSARV